MGQNGNAGTPRQKLEKVVIRFAGDSGDGMQLTGDRFTSEAALFGNDLATQPNYPAEIRAPQGTLPGVSSFQIQIADYDILTAGDRPDVLVAMNPAALKANVGDLPRGGLIIANSDEFTKRNLAKVGYDANPLESEELSDYVVQSVAMTTLTLGAVEAIGATIDTDLEAVQQRIEPSPRHPRSKLILGIEQPQIGRDQLQTVKMSLAERVIE